MEAARRGVLCCGLSMKGPRVLAGRTRRAPPLWGHGSLHAAFVGSCPTSPACGPPQIDVEGFEPSVLHGTRDLLLKVRGQACSTDAAGLLRQAGWLLCARPRGPLLVRSSTYRLPACPPCSLLTVVCRGHGCLHAAAAQCGEHLHGVFPRRGGALPGLGVVRSQPCCAHGVGAAPLASL